MQHEDKATKNNRDTNSPKLNHHMHLRPRALPTPSPQAPSPASTPLEQYMSSLEEQATRCGFALNNDDDDKDEDLSAPRSAQKVKSGGKPKQRRDEKEEKEEVPSVNTIKNKNGNSLPVYKYLGLLEIWDAIDRGKTWDEIREMDRMAEGRRLKK